MWCQIITSYPFICLFVVVIVFFWCTLVVNVWYREWYMGARRYGNSLRVFNSIAYEWAQRTSEMSSWTREEKFHIYKQPCISLFILFITSILKSLGPCSMIGPNWCDLFTIKNTIFFHVCCYGFSQGWKSLCNTVVYMVNRFISE